MSDEHQAYINRCITAVMPDGVNPSLASIAAETSVIELAGALLNDDRRAQAVEVFDPVTGL